MSRRHASGELVSRGRPEVRRSPSSPGAPISSPGSTSPGGNIASKAKGTGPPSGLAFFGGDIQPVVIIITLATFLTVVICAMGWGKARFALGCRMIISGLSLRDHTSSWAYHSQHIYGILSANNNTHGCFHHGSGHHCRQHLSSRSEFVICMGDVPPQVPRLIR